MVTMVVSSSFSSVAGLVTSYVHIAPCCFKLSKYTSGSGHGSILLVRMKASGEGGRGANPS